MSILQFESVSCKDCCKCIGVCPVKSIEVKNQKAMVVERDCILCGNCTVVCPQNLKHDVSDVAQVRELIRSGRPVVASVAPSYIAYFSGCGFSSFRSALMGLGFSDAFETAEGAYLVKTEYERLVREHPGKTYVSSCCSTVNAYVRKHCPEAIPYLAPILTPMQAHARLIRSRMPDAAVVFIGPCISKKAEVDEYTYGADCVLTFEEFNQWLENDGVALEPIPDPPETGGRARLFPTSGGILRSMQNKTPDYTYIVVDGQENPHAINRDQKFWEVQKYITNIHYMLWVGPMLVSDPWFRKLDPQTKALVEKAAKEAAAYEWKWSAEQDEIALKECLARGMVINDVSDEPAWTEAARSVWPQFYDKVGGKAVVDEALAIMQQ